MNMRAIQLDYEAIGRLKQYAEWHPVTGERFERMRRGLEGPIGDDVNHRLELPGGLRIVLSLEEQPKGLARHASFSVFPRKPDALLPDPALVEGMLALLGFKRSLLESDLVWIEGEVAVNVLQFDVLKGSDQA